MGNRTLGNFLVNVIMFLFPIILLGCIFELKLLDKSNGYTWKKQHLEQKLNSIEILVLGSSHAYYAIDPEYFCKSTYNLAFVSQSLYYDIKLADKYLKAMPALKTVIISISDFTFGYEIADSPEYWRSYYYERFFQVSSPNDLTFDIRRVSLIYLYHPLNALNLMFKNDKMLVKDIQETGYYKASSSSTISFSSGKERARYHQKLYNFQNVSININLVGDFIADLKNRGITPIIVQLPVYYTYSIFTKDKQVITSRIIDSICISNKINQFNYTDIFRFDKTCFFDNDHLNVKGAKILSLIINKDVCKK
jgi:hypothetical protein